MSERATSEPTATPRAGVSPATADVVVVGAGPAGSAAAIRLARAGREVLLVDRARFPRDKTCGDGLTTLALRHLEGLGLDPAAVPSWMDVHGAFVRSPGGRRIELPLPRGRGRFAAVAPRVELDAALVDLARAAGAKVHDGHALLAARAEADRVRLEVEGLGSIEARYAVGADGMWSPLRKALGAGVAGYRGEWHAFRQYVGGVTGRAATELWVWFEPDLLPGYAWSFPLPGGRVNLGFGVLRGGRVAVADMGPLWRDLLARPHVVRALGPDARPEGPPRAWPIPAAIGSLPLSAAGGRVLFVGDAAAATDVLTGEGIGQALLTGELAAEAIVRAGACEPSLAADWYHAAVHDELVADDRMSRALGWVLQRPWGARGSVRVAGLTPWTRRNFARWLFEDEPRAVVLTPRRWHRQFLGRPGAYAASG